MRIFLGLIFFLCWDTIPTISYTSTPSIYQMQELTTKEKIRLFFRTITQLFERPPSIEMEKKLTDTLSLIDTLPTPPPIAITPSIVQTGAQQIERYIRLLIGKRVAILANHTSVIIRKDGSLVNLVDTLYARGVNIVKIFAPEHGFRGMADAGKRIKDSVDVLTKIPIVSLYGKYVKPKSKDLKNVDIVIYDVQDVGVRFYTYIATFQYLMEACIENSVPLLVLDRPNPNGFYVDGPILKKAFKSMVGRQEIPVVYGMTIGEYAQMLYQEGLLEIDSTRLYKEETRKFILGIIPCLNYTHRMYYHLPVPPSPNLPNMLAIYLYPSLCFFEGTTVSVGRGTRFPFQCYGSPEFNKDLFSFKPMAMVGAKNPPHLGKECFGYDLRDWTLKDLIKKSYKRTSPFTMFFLLSAFQTFAQDSTRFFLRKSFFNRLAGSDDLYNYIILGLDEAAMRKEWKIQLDAFKRIRKQYLLYEDFE